MQARADAVQDIVGHAQRGSNACAPRLPGLRSAGVPFHLVRYPVPTALVLPDGTVVTSLTAAWQNAMAAVNCLAHRPAYFVEEVCNAWVALYMARRLLLGRLP